MVGFVWLNLAGCIWAMDLVRRPYDPGCNLPPPESEWSANHTTHLGHLELYLKATRKKQTRNKLEMTNAARNTFLCSPQNSQVIKGTFSGEHSWKLVCIHVWNKLLEPIIDSFGWIQLI